MAKHDLREPFETLRRGLAKAMADNQDQLFKIRHRKGGNLPYEHTSLVRQNRAAAELLKAMNAFEDAIRSL